MRKKAIIFMLLFILLVALVSIIIYLNCNEKSNNSQLPNPASVYCEEQGGVLEIRTNLDGSQTGYCTFSDGSECEEWSYYRRVCGK